jgi:hypothetical protein
VILWIIPAPLVRQIHKGVLPPLQHGTFSVQPDGLDAFLDLIDEYIQETPEYPTTQVPYLTITCADGPGTDRARRRYCMSRKVYGCHEG